MNERRRPKKKTEHRFVLPNYSRDRSGPIVQNNRRTAQSTGKRKVRGKYKDSTNEISYLE